MLVCLSLYLTISMIIIENFNLMVIQYCSFFYPSFYTTHKYFAVVLCIRSADRMVSVPLVLYSCQQLNNLSEYLTQRSLAQNEGWFLLFCFGYYSSTLFKQETKRSKNVFLFLCNRKNFAVVFFLWRCHCSHVCRQNGFNAITKVVVDRSFLNFEHIDFWH